MKIAVALPSRERPRQMNAVLTALDELSTGANQISYLLVVDSDDPASVVVANQVAQEIPGVSVSCGARDILAKRCNEILQFDADAYFGLADDTFPLVQGWDALIEQLVQGVALPAFSWQEKNDPGNCTAPVFSRRWVDAIGLWPEHFPFWFADTWTMEVFALTFAKPIAVVNQLPIGGRRGATKGMRDLEFWFRFFAQTRVERIHLAEKLARAHGFTLNVRKERKEQLAFMEQQDAYQLTQIPRYEAVFKQDEGDPPPHYLRAKALAQNWHPKLELAA